ncbi:hypothetical protein N8683_00465 [bacterium]|nr:hypothetical protein [bacterium]
MAANNSSKLDSSSQLYGRVQKALLDGLDYLKAKQNDDGEFCINITRHPSMIGPKIFDSTPFATGIVYHALSFLKHPTAARLRLKALFFIRSQMQKGGVWSYWTEKSGKEIVPDLDDTAVMSRILFDSGDSLFPNLNIQRILENRDKFGMFYTWLNKPHTINDVDSVVNCNCAWYLGDHPAAKPVMKRLLEIVKKGKVSLSYWYYLEDLAFYYAFSRAAIVSPPDDDGLWKKLLRAKLDNIFASKKNLSPLSAALALCVTCKLDTFDSKAEILLVEQILNEQSRSGEWPAIAYYAGPEPPQPHRVWFGSSEVTTAYCIEALAQWIRLRQR